MKQDLVKVAVITKHPLSGGGCMVKKKLKEVMVVLRPKALTRLRPMGYLYPQ
jgi:hypothetical protein